MVKRSFRSLPFAILSSLVAICLLASTLFAGQEPKEPTAEQKELLGYQLSMDKIHNLFDTTRDLKDWQDKNPEQGKLLNANAPTSVESIAAQTKIIDDKLPQAAAIIKNHGFSAHEYLVGLCVFIQSTVLVSMKKSGQAIDATGTNEVVHPANIELIEKNWSEISKLMSSLK